MSEEQMVNLLRSAAIKLDTIQSKIYILEEIRDLLKEILHELKSR